jgi:branched-chain amino acid transport system substrate-binding protein
VLIGILQFFLSPDAFAENAGAPASKSGGKGPIKIGFLSPLTGVAAPGGQDLINGMQLFLDQIHHRVAGREVQLIVENDESSAATAAAKIKKLVEQDHVAVLDGIILSNMAYAAVPFVERYQVPMIFPISAADDLTKRKHSHWVIRTGWSASQPAHPFGEYAYKTMGYRRVAVLGVDYPMAWEFVGGFQKTFEEAGGKVVQKIWAPLGITDFTRYIKEIRPDADAVFLMTAVGAADIIARQIKEIGPHLPIIGGGPSYDEATLQAVGDPTLGAVTAFYYSGALDTPANVRFQKAFKEKFGMHPGQYAEAAYVSGMWIKKAIEAINGDVEDRPKFLAALQKVELSDAPRGPLKMDGYGNPIQDIYIRKVAKVGGELVNKVVFRYPKVSQFWKYNPEDFLKQPPYSRDYPPCKYCTEK